MDRKKSTVIRIVAWSITAGVLLLILLLGIFGVWNFSIGFSGGTYYKNAEDYSVGSGSVPAQNITDLDINWINGKVNVSVYDGDEIVFQEKSNRTLKDEEKLRYLCRDGRLIIQYCKANRVPISFGIGIGNSTIKELEVKIPKDLAQQLEYVSLDGVSAVLTINGIRTERLVLDGVSGDINASDIEANSIDTDTTSGDIYLTDVSSISINVDTVSGSADLADVTTDKLNYSSTSGKINGKNLAVNKKADTDTVSGRVVLEGAIANLSHSSVSGALELETTLCPEDLNLDTTSGSLKLIIPDNSGFTVNFDSVSGDLNSDFPGNYKNERFTSGDGSRHYVISTVSGDADILKN